MKYRILTGGVMGVPLTFFEKYNKQFKILGVGNGRGDYQDKVIKKYINAKQHNPDGCIESGAKANTCPCICLNNISNKDVYYTADNQPNPFKSIYDRILIRREINEI